MRISTRFSIAVHILALVAKVGDAQKTTSQFLAGSVGVNPVVIRKTCGLLKRAGLLEVAAGTGGATLSLPAHRISLLAVYRAVNPEENERLFSLHESPNPACPVGRNINSILNNRIRAAQSAMESALERASLADLVAEIY